MYVSVLCIQKRRTILSIVWCVVQRVHEASLREVEREREELAERVASSEGEGRRRLREMQRQVGGRTVA